MKNLATVIIPALPVRFEARDSSEMVNQLLLGETVEILQKDKQWLQIKSTHDDYVGWVDEKGILTEFLENESFFLSSITGIAQNQKSTMLLSIGSILQQFDPTTSTFTIGGEQWTLTNGSYHAAKTPLKKDEILQIAQHLQHVPYLWGGRSTLGIDCSGFTQILYRFANVQLPRDASLQVLMGEEVSFVQNAEPGDLAFFGNDENKITHVGVLLSEKEIIHASGCVRIDAFDQQGIYNGKLKKYTHFLRIIKRI